MWFIVVHIVWFAVWLVWNINPHGKNTFDPFPFALMTMIVSLEVDLPVALHPDEPEQEWPAG